MSNSLPLCCFGAGGHGRTVATQWYRLRRGQVVFADEKIPVGTDVAEFRVKYSSLDEIRSCEVLPTVGDNAVRRRMHLRACEIGLRLAVVIMEPDHYFAPKPGDGSVILAGSLVNSSADIGAGVIVNSGAVVEHDCVVGDFAHVSPNATLTGGCHIGEGVWVGAGAVVLPGVAVAPGCIVGAGAVVTRDLHVPGTYVGAPARLV